MATSQVCRTYGEYRRLMGRLKEEDEAKERLPDVSCLRPVLEPIRKLSQESNVYERPVSPAIERRLYKATTSEYASPLFDGPALIGTFKFNENGHNVSEFIDSPQSGLPVLQPPAYRSYRADESGSLWFTRPCNLLDGYVSLEDGGWDVTEHFKSYDGTATLYWMCKHHDILRPPGFQKPNKNPAQQQRLFDVDFACDSGELQAILAARSYYGSADKIYENNGGDEIVASMYKGLIFLKKTNEDEGELTDWRNKGSYSGLRFEEMMTGRSNMKSTGRNPILNFNDSSSYNLVLRSKVGPHKLLYVCQSDSVQNAASSGSHGQLPNVEDMVELKTVTAKSLYKGSDCRKYTQMFHRIRTMAWWSQLVTCGVPNIEVGIKDDQMQVERTRRFNIHELVAEARGWDPDERFEFLHRFLDRVKSYVKEDDPKILYKFGIKNGHIAGPLKVRVRDESQQIIKQHIVDIFDTME